MGKIEVFEDGKKIHESQLGILTTKNIGPNECTRLILRLPKRKLTEEDRKELEETINRFAKGDAKHLALPNNWDLLAILKAEKIKEGKK